jgi:hypothetical protein
MQVFCIENKLFLVSGIAIPILMRLESSRLRSVDNLSQGIAHTEYVQ